MKIMIPGLHGSNADHWQTRFEKSDAANFMRVEQKNWDAPDCETWIHQIEKDLNGINRDELILIGHSIGCMAIVKWHEKFGHKIKGALLVAPSDAERASYPSYITGFTPIPTALLPFPTIIVASMNDPVTEIRRSQKFAKNWGSKLVIIENCGHIEPKNGFGEWSSGLN